jgi:hypothetical protein
MATKKSEGNPSFPHPPLEVGVAQYPTPLVPNYNDKTGGWSINDQGHIILVEKASIEKGSFTPQPLDGSVIYTGRDANRWPSSLYLVAERPTPEGEFIYRYWANDRTLASQDLWNYGLDYSSNNPDYPVTSRTYIVPRSQYSTEALGSVDPVFGGTQVLAQQKMIELPEDNPLYSRYVAVQRVYESIPGPVLSGKQLDARGDLETITVQTVVAGTAPTADSLLVTGTSVEPVDSVKSTKKLNTVEYYATLTTKAQKAGLLGITSTTDDIVTPATNPNALSLTVLESTVEALTATKSKRKTTVSSGPTSLVGYQYDEFFDQNLTITESIVAAGSELSHSNGILSYRDEPIDSAKSKRLVVSTPSLPPSRTEYKTGTYTSPLLVFDIVYNEANMACPPFIPDIRIKLTPVTRASQSGPTTYKTITSYSYGMPSPAQDTNIFSPALKEVAFTGYVVNFNLGAALCDNLVTAGNGIFVKQCFTGLANVVYETWNIPATSPYSATDYLNLVNSGVYQKVSWESRYWKAGIWESKTIYVKLI